MFLHGKTDRTIRIARRNPTAFTLIEMLVVVAIIGILAAMLMPGLQNALNSARKLTCSSQVRSSTLACLQYAEDSNGELLLRFCSGSSILWSKNLLNNGYIDDWHLTTCNVQPHQLYHAYLTYGVNYHFQSSKYEYSPTSGPATGGDYLLVKRISSPGNFVFLADSQVYGGDSFYPNGCWKIGANQYPSAGYGNIYFRHNGYANCSFADGHVETFNNPCQLRPYDIRKTVSYEGTCISLP